MEIRILRGHEISSANQLIRQTFMKNIDNTFSKEGIDEFLSYFQDEVILALMKEKKINDAWSF